MSDRDAFLRAIADNPEDTTARGAFADWLDEHGEPDQAAAFRACQVIVDEDTDTAIRQLAGCRMAPGSWDKRFVRKMMTAIIAFKINGNPNYAITVKQWVWVWNMAWKYRRQLTKRVANRAGVLHPQRAQK